MTQVPCPNCRTPVPWTPESRYRPFCSKRCKLVDLGDWLDESHRIPSDSLDEGELDSLPVHDPAND